MKFRTKSGAVYEVDEMKGLIRRLGESYGGKRVDESWKPYLDFFVAIGYPALIAWPTSVELLPGSPSEALPMTVTTQVEEITYDDGEVEK